ncbi:MAG: ABC transporter ATP-binding protein, partial [Dehalococcoidia bacterium]
MVELKLKDIDLGYWRKLVVRDINFEVKPGEMLGIVGANGCGKSTIIKALGRIIKPFSGHILLNDKDIEQIPRVELSRLLGVVPQMPLLPSTFTAFEIVLMGRNPHLGLFQYEGKNDMAIAWQAMGKTATQHLAERRIGQLSGGEIQSIVIARVLAQQTNGILLDEPTANLDIGRQIEILDLIKGLSQT